MRKEVEVNEALKMLLDVPVKLEVEPITIGEAHGRVSSETILAEISLPPFDRSPFDGYALRGEDTAAATEKRPVTLSVRQEIPAGFMPRAGVTTGHAARIMTGAPIPPGADAIVKFEETEFTKYSVTITGPVKPGSDIIHAGEDVLAGSTILSQGEMIEPATMGLLAAQGLKYVKVYKRPVVSVVNTGTELAELGRPLLPGMIYNSSMYTLHGFLSMIGVEFRSGGIVADDERSIAARVRAELTTSDMVITTGGASVGDYDCAVAAAEVAGGDLLFWKVQMKPGGSILAYTLGGKLVLSLSGNPGAAILGLLMFGLPSIKKRRGLANVLPEESMVKLANDIKKSSPRLRIIRGWLKIVDGEAFFVENVGQGGGDISSLVGCDLLAEIPAGSPALSAGTLVKVYRVFK